MHCCCRAAQLQLVLSRPRTSSCCPCLHSVRVKMSTSLHRVVHIHTRYHRTFANLCYKLSMQKMCSEDGFTQARVRNLYELHGDIYYLILHDARFLMNIFSRHPWNILIHTISDKYPRLIDEILQL